MSFRSLVFGSGYWTAAGCVLLACLVFGGVLFWVNRESGGDHAQTGKITASAPPEPAPGSPDILDVLGSATAFPPSQGDPRAAAALAAHAAYARHTGQLIALHQELAAERAALKPGQSAAAFNVKAANYQTSLEFLAREETQVDAMDRSIPKAGPDDKAIAALGRLQLLASSGDYLGFGALLRQCLQDYRQSPVFARMVALGRQTLPNATPERLSNLVRQHQTNAVRAEMAAVTEEIEEIVNQSPPVVTQPPRGASVYHSEFDPGATKPDFNSADLLSTRQTLHGDYLYMNSAPGVYYRSAECEFNPQTKYFITNRDVPKKKLTDAEYGELTRLYRVLGHDQDAAGAAQPPQPATVNSLSVAFEALNTQLATIPVAK